MPRLFLRLFIHIHRHTGFEFHGEFFLVDSYFFNQPPDKRLVIFCNGGGRVCRMACMDLRRYPAEAIIRMWPVFAGRQLGGCFSLAERMPRFPGATSLVFTSRKQSENRNPPWNGPQARDNRSPAAGSNAGMRSFVSDKRSEPLRVLRGTVCSCFL